MILRISGVNARTALLALLIGALANLYLPSYVDAQTTFGSITGVVSDPSGAAVPRATVTVVNQDTGFSRSDQTSGSGVFSIADLLPGTYRVSVNGKGFSVQEKQGVALDANHVVNVDFHLTVG